MSVRWAKATCCATAPGNLRPRRRTISRKVSRMPRLRVKYRRTPQAFPSDFPQRLMRFKEESELPWAEIARRLGVDPETVRRCREWRVRAIVVHGTTPTGSPMSEPNHHL